MGGAHMQSAAMCNAQTLGVQNAQMPGHQGSVGCDPLSMAIRMAKLCSPAIMQMAMQMQQLAQQPLCTPPPQLALQAQAQWAGSPPMPSARQPTMQPMGQPMGQSSWQQPAQQPGAQQEAQKTVVQKSEARHSKAQRRARSKSLGPTERQVYALIKRNAIKKQRELEAHNRRKVKKTTTTKRPQQGAQPKREGGKPEEKSSAAQASSSEGRVLEMGALAVGQAKSEEQLTAYGGEQSEVQRLKAELEKQRQEHEAEVAALQGKLAAAQEAASQLVAAEAQLQDAQVASREVLAKAAKLESELAAMKEAADPKHAKAQAAHDAELKKEAKYAATAKREAASRAKLEQLQQEMDELRESMAQAEASLVEKDKQLTQAKEQADNAIQQLKEQEKAAQSKFFALRRSVDEQGRELEQVQTMLWTVLNRGGLYQKDRHELECASQELSHIQRRL